jgi:hypothetical protein
VQPPGPFTAKTMVPNKNSSDVNSLFARAQAPSPPCSDAGFGEARACPGDGSWRDLAEYRGRGLDTFFGKGSSEAQACCLRCCVSDACLFNALALEEADGGRRSGIWGGLGPNTRAQWAAYLYGRRIDLAGLAASESAWWADRLAGTRFDRGAA